MGISLMGATLPLVASCGQAMAKNTRRLAMCLGPLLVCLSTCASWAAEKQQQPSSVHYLSTVLGVYVGDKQPNGETQVILHREDRGGWPEVHFINGKRMMLCESSPSRRNNRYST